MTTQTRGTHISERLKNLNARLTAAGRTPEGTLTRAEKAVKNLPKAGAQSPEKMQGAEHDPKSRKLSKRQKREAQSEKATRERDERHRQNEALTGHCGMSNDGDDASMCVLGYGHAGKCQRPSEGPQRIPSSW